MAQKRTFKLNEMAELAKEMGIKMPKAKPVNEARRKEQREKFARCRACGGQMTRIDGTNVFVCKNDVDVEKTRTKEDGTTEKYTVKQMCGKTFLADKDRIDYVDYLFS